MATFLTRSLAVTAGGLALGLGIKSVLRSSPPGLKAGTSTLEPLLARVDELEIRIVNVEAERNEPALISETVQKLKNRVQSEGRQIEILRTGIERATGMQDERLVAMEQALGQLEGRVNNLIEQDVARRIADIHTRLEGEIQDTLRDRMRVFSDQISGQVTEKVISIENDMARQSNELDHLHKVSLGTNEYLQNLLTKLDRLGEKIDREPGGEAAQWTRLMPTPVVDIEPLPAIKPANPIKTTAVTPLIVEKEAVMAQPRRAWLRTPSPAIGISMDVAVTFSGGGIFLAVFQTLGGPIRVDTFDTTILICSLLLIAFFYQFLFAISVRGASGRNAPVLSCAN